MAKTSRGTAASKKTAAQAAEKAAKVAVKKSRGTPPAESPFAREIAQLREDIDRTFERLFRGWLDWPRFPGRLFEAETFKDLWEPLMPRLTLTPRVDVAETDDAYEITAELPGLDEDDLEVTVTDDRLTIRGEKKSEQERKDKEFHRIERTYGAFQRTFPLPGDVDADKIRADFSKGVLTVTLPKSPEAKARQRRIAIKSK